MGNPFQSAVQLLCAGDWLSPHAFSPPRRRGEGGRRPDEGWGHQRRRPQPLTPALSPSPRKGEGASGFGPQSLSRRSLLGWLLLAAVAASAQPTAPENQIKGAFLAKLSQYIEWPAATFAKADQPIVIGILGEDTFGREFDVSLRAFKVAGRAVQARRLRRVEEAKGCHLLYVSPSENGNLRTILTALRSQPILTAGDHPEFLKLGGALRFWRKGESLAFHISADALREAQITAHPRLLQLSDDPAKPR